MTNPSAKLAAQPWPMAQTPGKPASSQEESTGAKLARLGNQAMKTSPDVDAALDKELAAGEAFCAAIDASLVDGESRNRLLDSAVAFTNAAGLVGAAKSNAYYRAIVNVLIQNLGQAQAALQKARASPPNSHMLGTHDPREGQSGLMVPDVRVELPPININFAEGSFQLTANRESSELWLETSPDGRQTRIARNPTNRDRFR
jgi:hypothetical protein